MLSLKLAWRNLFRNVRRTFLTCLLLSSALIVLILSDGLILGTLEVMTGSITDTLEGEAQVNRKGFRTTFEAELVIDDPDAIVEILESDNTVTAYAPRVILGAMVASSYNTSGGLIYGVDSGKELSVSRISDAIVEGEYLTGGDREILLGKKMAHLLEVKLGDRIILTAAAVDTNEISQELFRVSGIFEFGLEELDENFVFINLHKAQQVFGMQDKLHQIAIKFNDPDIANQEDLELFKRIGNDEVEANGWLELQPSIGAMIAMTNYATAIVGSILFLITSLGVINSMFMSIYERIYEFGVAKAIGTTPGQIVQLVLLEALFLALISCVFGLALGYLASDYFSTHGIPMGRMEFSGIVLSQLYTKISIDQFTNFPVYVTILTVVAAIYPAIFASRIVPTQALQRAL